MDISYSMELAFLDAQNLKLHSVNQIVQQIQSLTEWHTQVQSPNLVSKHAQTNIMDSIQLYIAFKHVPSISTHHKSQKDVNYALTDVTIVLTLHSAFLAIQIIFFPIIIAFNNVQQLSHFSMVHHVFQHVSMELI